MRDAPERMVKSLGLQYGLRVGPVGEDGDFIALGHHSNRRTIAAMHAEAKGYYGALGLAEGGWPRSAYSELASRLKRTWAILAEHCDYALDEVDHDADCGECRMRREGDWYIEWGHTRHHYRAFPIMLWTP